MATRSDQVGRWLQSLGVKRGDAVMLMLGEARSNWPRVRAFAIMKIGAVIPTDDYQRSEPQTSSIGCIAEACGA
jgi:acyl-coenzyme A synthetase/AMP-(fatty) acid ligase